MVGCVLSQLEPSELYILSCGKGLGLFHSQEWSAPRALSYIGLLVYEILGRSYALDTMIHF